MADNSTPSNPAIIVDSTGAPAGSVYVHDQASGATVLAPADNYTDTIKGMNQR